MKVFVYSLGDAKPHRDQVRAFSSFASLDQSGVYKLIDSPREADIIICFDQGSYHNYGEFYDSGKTFIYSSKDLGFSFIPGLFTSVKNCNHSTIFSRSTTYLNVTTKEDLDQITSLSLAKPTKYLFSFVGNSKTCKIRKSLFDLKNDRYHSSDSDSFKHTLSYQDYWLNYLKSLSESSFILCPRGMGVSSIRLFETMRAGRVPVIIADQWVPPAGPAWDDFSIRIRESNIHLIPEILEKHESFASDMGATAKIEWNKYYSTSNIFNHLMSQYNEMLELKRDRLKSSLWYALRLIDPRNTLSITYPIVKNKLKNSKI